MATKTKPIEAAYGGTPGIGNKLGEAYATQNYDRQAMIEIVAEEHQLVPGTDTPNHGKHLPGSAVSYVGTAEPTTRPNSSDVLGVADVGRIWLDTSALPVLKVKIYKEVFPVTSPATYGWKEAPILLVWVDNDGTWVVGDKVEKTLSEIIDQELLHDSEVTFGKVTAGSIVGPLDGVANKIRTSAPASPASGDIWVG